MSHTPIKSGDQILAEYRNQTFETCQLSLEEMIDAEISKVAKQRDELQQQRDTLLAALNALYSAVDSCVDLTPQVMQQARAAIASIESPTQEQAGCQN